MDEKTIGRPSVYDEQKHVEAALLSAADGATWEAIASACEVSRTTVIAWCDEESATYHPLFADAVNRARAKANDCVVSSLFRRANGYEFVETSVVIEEMVNATRGSVKEMMLTAAKEAREEGEFTFQVKRTTTTKHVIPDTGAQALWLCNRDKANWQHVQNIKPPREEGEGQVVILDDVPAPEEPCQTESE